MEKYYLAAIQAVSGIGSQLLQNLVGFFGSGQAVWQASEEEILNFQLLPLAVRERLLQARRHNPDQPARLQEACSRQGIRLCQISDQEYPELLKEIYSPPLVLFYRGTLQNHIPRIAMVGARRVTAYGRTVADKLAQALAEAGFAVVSGAARGVDAISHQGALLQGRTEAVLGCGVDVAYPPENRKLLEEIAESGAVISEYGPGCMPVAGNFPARNRIISGMSLGTVVVEAAERSGSLITAQQAMEEGRDVFAVPGSIFSASSKGCHRLIQQGAKLVVNSQDVLEEYKHLLNRKASKEKNAEKFATRAIMSDVESKIMGVLSPDEPLSIDEIIYRLQGQDAAQVAFILLQLEFKGFVRADELQRYTRVMKEDFL